MIIFDDGFLTEFFNNRTVAIAGGLGDGKTLIALEIAELLLRDGYKLVSNMSCVWNDHISTIGKKDKVVVIVDEGGTYLRTGESVNNFSRFLRKLDYYLIMPCKKFPHEELCELRLYPWFNFYKNFGIPLKVWGYESQKYNKKYTGKVFQWGWASTYGIYSSIDPGDFPEVIMQFVFKRTEELFAEYQRTLKLSDVAVKFRDSGDREQVEIARDFKSAALEMQDALSVFERNTTKKRGR